MNSLKKLAGIGLPGALLVGIYLAAHSCPAVAAPCQDLHSIKQDGRSSVPANVARASPATVLHARATTIA